MASRVLLTGASSGIGRSLALRLSRGGARLVVAGRNRARLDALADLVRSSWGGDIHPIVADIADAKDRRRLLEQTVASLGGLDVLVNNAGLGATGFFEAATEERMRTILEVNFFAAVELTRLAFSHLKEGTRPLIVNVASVLGRRAIPGCAEYCASKFALVGWSEAVRAELAPYDIHVLIVCPGGVATAFDDNMVEKGRRITKAGRQRMSAYRCAKEIVAAMRARQNEVVITTEAKMALWANRFFPRLVDWLLARRARQAG